MVLPGSLVASAQQSPAADSSCKYWHNCAAPQASFNPKKFTAAIICRYSWSSWFRQTSWCYATDDCAALAVLCARF